MSNPTPAPHRRFPDFAAWHPSWRALLWVLLGFAVGLALFVLVWSGGRDKQDFYRAGDTPPSAAGREYAPLPAPLAGREGSASLSDSSPETGRADAGDAPRLVETTPPPPPPTVVKAPAAPASLQPRPIAGRTPAPRYPPQALRRGERGDVLVRAEVGVDGIPVSVTVARSSGSRLLDRAATDAVRRWRFQPAEINGQPAAGTVMVPIEFQPN